MGVERIPQIIRGIHWEPPLRNYQHLRPYADLGIQIGGKFGAGYGLRQLAADYHSPQMRVLGDRLIASGVQQLRDLGVLDSVGGADELLRAM